MEMLESVLEIAKATPPVDNKLSRFGNPAFKVFYDKIGEVSRTTALVLIPGICRAT
jgi:serine/threonine-protein phosphatase 2A activator